MTGEGRESGGQTGREEEGVEEVCARSRLSVGTGGGVNMRRCAGSRLVWEELTRVGCARWPGTLYVTGAEAG